MNTTATDPFFDVPRTTRATSEGPVELPILYRNVRSVVALFTVPKQRASELLVGTGLKPAPLGLGRAVVALALYEYLDTSVGVYNEVGTAIFALRENETATPLAFLDLLRPPTARRLGMYVVDLPVTTAAANAAGREIWGYPKFITAIPFQLTGHKFDSAVLDPTGDSEIFRISGTFGAGISAQPLSLMTYTRKDGALIRTHVDVRGPVQLCAPGSLTLRVGASKHGMATRLRSLGLDGARPRVVMVTDKFQSLLHEGTIVR